MSQSLSVLIQLGDCMLAVFILTVRQSTYACSMCHVRIWDVLKDLKWRSVGRCQGITYILFHFRETHGTGSTYHKELAKQLASFLDKPLQVKLVLLEAIDFRCMCFVRCNFCNCGILDSSSPLSYLYVYGMFSGGVIFCTFHSCPSSMKSKPSKTKTEFIFAVLSINPLILNPEKNWHCNPDSCTELTIPATCVWYLQNSRQNQLNTPYVVRI